MIAPKAFKGKDKDAEALLIDFDLYVKTVKNFFIATGKDSATDKQKVVLLQAVGGPDMVDLVEEVGMVILVSTPKGQRWRPWWQTPLSRPSARSERAL